MDREEIALPRIQQRCSLRLSRINVFTQPKEISFTSFLPQEMERELCTEDTIKFCSDLSENGKVLTVDLSSIQLNDYDKAKPSQICGRS